MENLTESRSSALWLTAKKEKFMRYVYVLDVDGNPLMPTRRYGWVRRMLKSGKANAEANALQGNDWLRN